MIAAVVIVVAAAIVLAATLVMLGGKSNDDGLVTGPMSERIIQAGDLGSEWRVRTAFSNDTGYSETGAYEIGTIVLERHNASGGVALVVQVWMIFYNSTENATSSYTDYVTEFATTAASTHLNPQQVNVGDGAMIYDLNRTQTGYGKSAIFTEKNVVCVVQYSIMSAQETLSDQMVIDLINKQIDKL